MRFSLQASRLLTVTSPTLSRIDSELQVRVSDTALARDLFPQDYHCLGDNENRPVKWLSLEALIHKQFTPANDVVRLVILLIVLAVIRIVNLLKKLYQTRLILCILLVPFLCKCVVSVTLPAVDVRSAAVGVGDAGSTALHRGGPLRDGSLSAGRLPPGPAQQLP